MKASVVDGNSYQREFNPKRRVYAPQEYQAHHTKTTEKAISKLEISVGFDRLKRKIKKHIIQEVAVPRKELLGIEHQVPANPTL